MEALLSQSRSLCPFLQRTSPATLRSLSTATPTIASPGGGTISNLQVIARRCPVMSKALAVQSARLAGARRLSTVAGSASGMVAIPGVKAVKPIPGKKCLHTSAIKEASIDQETYRKHTTGWLVVIGCVRSRIMFARVADGFSAQSIRRSPRRIRGIFHH